MSQVFGKEAARRILVADDFDDTRLMMKLWLERKGYQVLEAENGNDAVRLAESEHPDLIIMDIEMPGADGIAATRRIRKVEGLRDLPIVAVSAYGVNEYRARALEAGCSDYVSTPFEPDLLSKLIEGFLRRQN
jgi:CheY-like chemotaxis protein